MKPVAIFLYELSGKGKDRANARSVTPIGFMRAVFEANFGASTMRAAA